MPTVSSKLKQIMQEIWKLTYAFGLTEVWDVAPAIEYVKKLESLKPWFIEEPTAPDDISGSFN